MATTQKEFRRALHDDILARLRDTRNVIAAGPNGSGRSFLLRSIVDRLRNSTTAVLHLHGSDRKSYEKVQNAPPESVIVIDGLECAAPPLLRILDTHIRSGGALVSSLDTGSQNSRDLQTLDADSGASRDARRLLDAADRVSLEPLSDHDIEFLIHADSDAPVDADSVYAICRLAEGRPSWALDLLTIARHGSLISSPGPAITSVPFGALHLPAVHSLTRSIGQLSAETASAAVALSDLEARDFTGVTELIGGAASSVLLDRGILLRKQSEELYYVPPFLAMALRPQTEPQHLYRAQSIIAEHLLTQEALGIPITDAEAALCARVLGAQPATSADPLTLVEARIVHRVSANHLTFDGGSAARTLLLRAGSIETPNDPLHRAKALGVLAGPSAGLGELDTLSFPEDSPEAAAAHFLRAQFFAESDFRPDAPTAERLGEASDIERLFLALNTPGALPSETSLRTMASRIRMSEITELATALDSLDSVIQGRLPEGTWLAAGDPVPLPRQDAPEQLALIVGAALLAQAITVLMSGELALRADELRAAAERLASREYHHRWLRHLLAAGTALTCGNAERAQIEWSALQQRVPRFIPTRLRVTLEHIAAAIDAAAAPDTEFAAAPAAGSKMVHRFVSYLTGQHDMLLRTRDVGALDEHTLPVIRLANAHLTASEERNPTELLKISGKLQRLELWAPAAFALTEARMTFISRRAAGGVRKCDLALAEFEKRLRRRVPWHRPGDLPTSDRVRLTPRERSVAVLAAEGLTNRDISCRLGCSVRTVESHLAQARAKLGAASRRDLSGRLLESA